MSSSPRPGAELLRDILRRNRGKLLLSSLLLSCWTAGEALVPAVVGGTIDEAIATGDPVRLAVWLGALVLVFVALSYGYRFGARISNGVLQHETHALRTRVAQRALDPRGSLHPHQPGEIASLASSDADVAGASVRQVALGVAASLGLFVCSAYLLFTQVWLGALVLILVPAGLRLLRALTPALTRRTEEHQATVAEASGSVADLLHGAPVLRGVGAHTEAAAWFGTRSRASVRAAIRAAGPSGRLDAFSVLVSGVVLAAVTGVGGWLVVRGDLSAGELIGVLGVTAFLATPITGLVTLAEGLSRARGAAARISAFLDEPAARTGSLRPTPRPDAALTLSWDAGEREATDGTRPDGGGVGHARGGRSASATDGTRPDGGVVVHVPGGTFTAIVCQEASLPARWDASFQRSDGRAGVGVDGVDWSAIDAAHAHLVVQPVPHEAHLFRGSVSNNVVRDGDVPAQIWRASGAHELVDGWAHGAQHELHEGGANLSGGQRQRLALARALAVPAVPRILIDPTTAVDSVTEALIARGLTEWRADAGSDVTLAVFTTSPALAAVADRVVFVGADGTGIAADHESLMQHPDYAGTVGR